MKNMILFVLASFFLHSHAYAAAAHHGVQKLTQEQTAEIIAQAGFPQELVPVVTCLAEHESNFRPAVVNKNTNHTYDYGLLQINDVWVKQCHMTRADLKNPLDNAKCAYQIYQSQGLTAWVTFNKFKSQCLTYQVPTWHVAEDLAYTHTVVHNFDLM